MQPTPPPTSATGPTRVSLADASRITGRPDSTIKGWKAAGEFTDDEYTVTPRRQGSGFAVSILVSALERVHRARGGLYWHPQAASVANLPPHAAAYVAHLEHEVARLSAELARLRKALGERWAGRISDPADLATLGTLGSASDPGNTSGILPGAGTLVSAHPEDVVPASWFAAQHGFIKKQHMTWRDALMDGRIPFVSPPEGERWKWDRQYPTQWLDAHGREVFCQVFAKRITRCRRPECECHQGERSGAAEPLAPREPVATLPRALAGAGR